MASNDDDEKKEDKESDEEEEEHIAKMFKVVLEDPLPAGVKISKKSTCQITIVPDDDTELAEAVA